MSKPGDLMRELAKAAGTKSVRREFLRYARELDEAIAAGEAPPSAPKMEGKT